MKINVILISFILLGSFNVHALILDPTRTNRRLFVRYARPQLRIITRDFYDIVKVFPGSKTLLDFRQSLNKLHSNWEELHTICPDRITKECQEKLEELFADGSALERQIMAIMSDEEIYLGESTVHTKRMFFGKIFLETELLSSHIKYCLTSLILREDSSKCVTLDFSKKISIIRTAFQQALINTLPPGHREHFERVYMHFIIPIEQKVLRVDNRQYLYQHLDDFNMVWNQFHLALTRRGIVKVEGETQSKLKTMHSRWNSILKMVLKR
jgi:hypothetical protein